MNRLHGRHNKMFRDPAQITGLWNETKVDARVFEVHADRGWKKTLDRLGVTLLVTREYEHMVFALSAEGTTWMRLPHPSGLVADRERGAVHIACTRNPNLLMELKGEVLLPSRVRFLPGALYLHDLALIGGKLYGNAAGQNSIVRLDYEKGAERVWWPKCVERRGRLVYQRNYIQLNSIAAGKNLRSSYFSASSDRVGEHVPGDLKFPVDQRGVIFSGATREPVVYGLTRPHSARLRGNELWVDNSGYGEVGRVIGKSFQPLVKLESWTRGLCFVKDVFFVGVSRVLPRFHVYAPGLDHRKSRCGLVAVQASTGRVLGRLTWPQGNQIFAIDWMKGARLPFGGKQEAAKLFYSFNR